MTERGVREERQPAATDVVEVAPGVLRLQLPISLPGLGHVNCYALPDRRGVTLVDPGLPGRATSRALATRLAQIGLDERAVHTVVVTHSHPDHFGQAGRLHRRTGAKVITHRTFRTLFDPAEEPSDDGPDAVVGAGDAVADATADAAERADHAARGAERAGAPPRRADPFGPTPWGGPAYRPPLVRRLRYRALRLASGRLWATARPTHRVDDADLVELGDHGWVAVHTPGHTVDHLCLLDPERGVLLSGDHVLPTITPHISGLGGTDDPLTAFFASLDRVGRLDGVATVLPAHGQPFADLPGRAAAIRRHHEERLDVLRTAGEELGWASVRQYTQRLFPERSWGPMADSETYAHLEHLRLAGDVDVRDDGTELRYATR
ncbi:MAG TPA: MBL fold metallo-hydrolase [Acidimicrobiales bacterium]|nr:MBL fold metallo-hydrolase [Acidimicrobiales bacterium]